MKDREKKRERLRLTRHLTSPTTFSWGKKPTYYQVCLYKQAPHLNELTWIKLELQLPQSVRHGIFCVCCGVCLCFWKLCLEVSGSFWEIRFDDNITFTGYMSTLLWFWTLVKELRSMHFLGTVWEHRLILPLDCAMLSTSCSPCTQLCQCKLQRGKLVTPSERKLKF